MFDTSNGEDADRHVCSHRGTRCRVHQAQQ